MKRLELKILSWKDDKKRSDLAVKLVVFAASFLTNGGWNSPEAATFQYRVPSESRSDEVMSDAPDETPTKQSRSSPMA